MALVIDFTLTWTEHTLEQLDERGIHQADALDVISGNHKTFKHEDDDNERYVIGETYPGSGLWLTIVIGLPTKDDPTIRVITAWKSNDVERTLYSRPGGTKHV